MVSMEAANLAQESGLKGVWATVRGVSPIAPRSAGVLIAWAPMTFDYNLAGF